MFSSASITQVGDDGTLNLNGTKQLFLKDIQLQGGLIDGEGGILNANEVLSFGGELSGLLSGNVDHLKVLDGTTILDADGNSVDIGTIIVANGTLKAGRANAFSASSDTTVKSGGTLDLGEKSQTINDSSINC